MRADKMRRGATALAAIAAAAGAGGVVTVAQASGTHGTERITMAFLTIAGRDQPPHVIASGPVSGVGTETQIDKRTTKGEINYATLHFDNGTVRFIAREAYHLRLDTTACTGRPVGGGTFTITGGSGAYKGISGSGTFKDGGIVIAQRDRNGTCRGERTPPADVVLYVTVTLTGTAGQPSA